MKKSAMKAKKPTGRIVRKAAASRFRTKSVSGGGGGKGGAPRPE